MHFIFKSSDLETVYLKIAYSYSLTIVIISNYLLYTIIWHDFIYRQTLNDSYIKTQTLIILISSFLHYICNNEHYLPTM